MHVVLARYFYHKSSVRLSVGPSVCPSVTFCLSQQQHNHQHVWVDTTTVQCQWSQNAWPRLTLNGYFTLNSTFAPLCLAFHRAAFENNCVKTNEDRHTLSAAEIFGRDSSFWHYKVCADIRAVSLEKITPHIIYRSYANANVTFCIHCYIQCVLSLFCNFLSSVVH